MLLVLALPAKVLWIMALLCRFLRSCPGLWSRGHPSSAASSALLPLPPTVHIRYTFRLLQLLPDASLCTVAAKLEIFSYYNVSDANTCLCFHLLR